MPRPAARRRFDNLIEYALVGGHVAVRRARLAPGVRYKIDARDPAVTTIYLSTELAVRDHREVWNAVCEHLHATLGERHRQGLGPVVELERDEVETQAATGTDGVTGDLYLSDLRARDRRAGFAVVPTPHRPRH